ncbi:hypothetical protein GGE45_002717 [Rhizobium aethiopicum]|uniref:hypothetical protein n=1 Tax=Rhizobium aethiopicum TaxID=1138170 RepID=UPI001619BF2C|nr:hypothetical protein [Rhizobium aethiopicum]MBB4580387.1 hypothetical protein [Rhizobium aethiopicum]
MDYGELYNATKAAFTDALAEHKSRPRLMRIDAFDAEDEDGTPVRVIGVLDDNDAMKFVVVEEDEDGAIFPVARQLIYRKGAAKAA